MQIVQYSSQTGGPLKGPGDCYNIYNRHGFTNVLSYQYVGIVISIVFEIGGVATQLQNLIKSGSR
jgi:hypothetical protein